MQLVSWKSVSTSLELIALVMTYIITLPSLHIILHCCLTWLPSQDILLTPHALNAEQVFSRIVRLQIYMKKKKKPQM